MKKRDLLLDFTSLLDVTLIVIFFFVIFGNLENQQNKQHMDEKISEYDQAIKDAEQKEAEAIQLSEQLQKEIAFVQAFDERKAANETELINFMRGENLKLIMDVSSSTEWGIRVIKAGEVFTAVSNGQNAAIEVVKALKAMGLDSEQTIFCDFVFNGDEVGSRAAYNGVNGVIAEIRKEYHFLYISETDLSIGGE